MTTEHLDNSVGASLTVYCLRHGMRGFASDFRAPLLANDTGYHGEDRVVEALEQLGPFDAIYTSPYIRTMETVDKYAKECRMPLRVDYRLMERIDPADYRAQCLPLSSAQGSAKLSFALSREEKQKFNVSDEMRGTELVGSLEAMASGTQKEDDDSLKGRLKQFFDDLMENHTEVKAQGAARQTKILVVAHQSSLRALIGYALAGQAQPEGSFNLWNEKPQMGSIHHVTFGTNVAPKVQKDFDGFAGVEYIARASCAACAIS